MKELKVTFKVPIIENFQTDYFRNSSERLTALLSMLKKKRHVYIILTLFIIINSNGVPPTFSKRIPRKTKRFIMFIILTCEKDKIFMKVLSSTTLHMLFLQNIRYYATHDIQDYFMPKNMIKTNHLVISLNNLAFAKQSLGLSS